MWRRITLSILILLSVVTILPFADSAARGIQQSISMHRRHHRRHSRRWWRRHRALMRRRQAAMAHRRATLALKPTGTGSDAGSQDAQPQLPAGWNTLAAAPNGE